MKGRGGRPPRVAGVLLAAGESRRFGGPVPKQLALFAGEPLVRHAARTALASSLAGLTVVVGHAASEVVAALAGLPLSVVENPAYAGGQSTSVRAGLAAVGGDAAAALFLPCDQPWLSAEVLDQLVAAYWESGGPIVLPSFADRRGAPVLFDRSLFAELATVVGDEGGRQVVARHPEAVVEVALEDGEALRDVDSADQLGRDRPPPVGEV